MTTSEFQDKIKQMEGYHSRIPLFIGLVFLFVLLSIEFAAIMYLNDGVLVYTLDDPYIHLALSENLRDGHYGVNSTEYSAPSSSILWPFIIAPFSTWEFAPIAFNIFAAILTIILFDKIIYTSLNLTDKFIKIKLFSFLLIALIFATNIVGLIFTGMEHSFQLLVVMIMALGLIVEVEKNRVPFWFLIAIPIAPLIRYENLAVSLSAIVYLFIRKYYKEALSALTILTVLILSFSIFLLSLGLEWFPTSVLVKSPIIGSEGKLYLFFQKVAINFKNPRGILLGLGLLGLLSFYWFNKRYEKEHQLVAICILAIIMHFVGGNYGGYHRYEIYIWAFFLVISLYVGGSHLTSLIAKKDSSNNLMKIIILMGGFVVTTSATYMWDLLSLPMASNNIYEQQYQMHRFASHFYNKPVAVNDLGYVSYKNNNYVLDLWGLASLEALKYRTDNQTVQGESWLNILSHSKGVECAMIYEEWFKNIPENWIKIGTLHLGKKNITPAGKEVAFYALTPDAYKEIVLALKNFVRTLPEGVEFSFE